MNPSLQSPSTRLFSHLVRISDWLFDGLFPSHQHNYDFSGLKSNWVFPFCAAAFYVINAAIIPYHAYLVSLLLTFGIALLIATRMPSMWSMMKHAHWGFHILAILTSTGICLTDITFAQLGSHIADRFLIPAPLLNNIVTVSLFIVAEMLFVYSLLLAFYHKLFCILKDIGILRSLRTWEIYFYACIILITFILIGFVFSKTNAFYASANPVDVIYTSDSSSFLETHVYIKLSNPENDLRQPLFAVFSAPFIGIIHFIIWLLGFSPFLHALLVNLVQVVMLFYANLILTKIMKLTPFKRACFILLSCFTYTHLLFTLMMEQYIIAYFWLILCFYQICENKKHIQGVFLCAGGTLLTGMALLPFISCESPFHNFKKWFADMIKYGLEFITLMLFFCRFDIFWNLSSLLSLMHSFSAVQYGLLDKLKQYLSFISGCFIAPDAGPFLFGAAHLGIDFPSWQLLPVTEINLTGIVILFLIIISVILNRDKIISRLAAYWVVFSIVILIICGWGIRENGLILYALYFGWAFLVLLFQLVEKLADMLKSRFLLPLTSIGAVITMAVLNAPGLISLIIFAFLIYPC